MLYNSSPLTGSDPVERLQWRREAAARKRAYKNRLRRERRCLGTGSCDCSACKPC